MPNASENRKPIQSKLIVHVSLFSAVYCELLALVIIRQNQFSVFVTLQNQNKGINSNQA